MPGDMPWCALACLIVPGGPWDTVGVTVATGGPGQWPGPGLGLLLVGATGVRSQFRFLAVSGHSGLAIPRLVLSGCNDGAELTPNNLQAAHHRPRGAMGYMLIAVLGYSLTPRLLLATTVRSGSMLDGDWGYSK